MLTRVKSGLKQVKIKTLCGSGIDGGHNRGVSRNADGH